MHEMNILEQNILHVISSMHKLVLYTNATKGLSLTIKLVRVVN